MQDVVNLAHTTLEMPTQHLMVFSPIRQTDKWQPLASLLWQASLSFRILVKKHSTITYRSSQHTPFVRTKNNFQVKAKERKQGIRDKILHFQGHHYAGIYIYTTWFIKGKIQRDSSLCCLHTIMGFSQKSEEEFAAFIHKTEVCFQEGGLSA